MAIAEHAPGKLYKRNARLKKMSHAQLHDFASAVQEDNEPSGKRLGDYIEGKHRK